MWGTKGGRGNEGGNCTKVHCSLKSLFEVYGEYNSFMQMPESAPSVDIVVFETTAGDLKRNTSSMLRDKRLSNNL